MASLVDGLHVLSMRHSVATSDTEGPARALLHLTVVQPHLGAIGSGMPGPRNVQLKLTRGQLDSLVAQLQRLAASV